MNKDNMIRREVPEKLKYGLEILLQRDDITPHSWEREDAKQYIFNECGKLYCTTYLSDEEWNEYLAFAICEVDRMESTMPDTPVVPEHSQNTKMISEACRRLGTTSYQLRYDEAPDLFELEDFTD